MDRIEKRISYSLNGVALWSWKELAEKYDLSSSIVRFYLNEDRHAEGRPEPVGKVGKGKMPVILFNAEAIDAWFAPHAKVIQSRIAGRRGRPRKAK